MAWTTPRTWSDDELVTPTIMNTHVRDQLIFLKSDPLISETTTTSIQTTAVGGSLAVATLTSVSVPADAGKVYCEVWAQTLGFTSAVANPQIAFLVLSETSAGEIGRSSLMLEDVGTTATGPFYLRTRDLSWASSSRTVTATLYGSNCAGQMLASAASPIVLRMVRSY